MINRDLLKQLDTRRLLPLVHNYVFFLSSDDMSIRRFVSFSILFVNKIKPSINFFVSTFLISNSH